MTFSKNRRDDRRPIRRFVSLRLKSIRNEYIEWKKKIDDGRKLIETMVDEQIIEQYKPFYEVTQIYRGRRWRHAFLFSAEVQCETWTNARSLARWMRSTGERRDETIRRDWCEWIQLWYLLCNISTADRSSGKRNESKGGPLKTHRGMKRSLGTRETSSNEQSLNEYSEIDRTEKSVDQRESKSRPRRTQSDGFVDGRIETEEIRHCPSETTATTACSLREERSKRKIKHAVRTHPDHFFFFWYFSHWNKLNRKRRNSPISNFPLLNLAGSIFECYVNSLVNSIHFPENNRFFSFLRSSRLQVDRHTRVLFALLFSFVVKYTSRRYTILSLHC